MNWLVEDFAFAAAAISEANLSGLAFGFFASLLAMTVGVEVRIKNPPLIANSHYLIRRGVLITLYVISMFFASAFVGLTLPSAKGALFSISGTVLTFFVCIAVFIYVDYLVQSAKAAAKLFMLLFTSLGILIQYLIHMAFIFIPNNHQVVQVRWPGLIAMYVFLFVCMGLLSRFAHETSVGKSKPLQSRMIYIFGIVGLNQMIALSLIGFVHVTDGPEHTTWYGLWTGWAGFEIFVSFFALLMISVLMCYVYVLLDKSVQILRADNQKLQVMKQDALAQVANASEKLELERTRIEQLERSIELVQHDHEMSVDSLVAAVATLEDGVFEWDIEQETVAFSSTWRRLFGFDEQAQSTISANAWRAGILSEDIKGLDAALQSCLTAILPSTAVQVRYATAYGSLLKLEIHLVAVKNAYGLPSKAVGIIHDRTEEMDLELSIREELNEESLLSSRKSQFVSYLSHEIRTPMTVIGSAKALLESSLQKEPVNMESALHYIDQIGGALRSLRALVDETLMFMGASFTRNHLNIAQLDIRKVFCQFSSFEQRRRHGQHWLEYELHPSVDQFCFYSDEYVFTQAMRQMLSFAEGKDSHAGKLIITMPNENTLNLCIELLEWPVWMVKAGQLEPMHDEETVVPFKGEHLPFTLLLTKRVIRLINGRIMIKNRRNRHYLCVDLPSLKEEACRVS
ncbi:histidine kinase dimerization/phospho-acceptor domain-containing protein [uncultured Limnobacter sp.]|uniref:histidine kinase dimerization/phospho-acceptor domain-containing protein n=1 Tax=uncultured Limnobacter sp. TaxID=199681 RepID=UPI0030FB6F7A